MSLFYFDLYDGETATRDRHGIDLENVEEAAEQAAALLPDVARDILPAQGSRDFATFVRNEDGDLVHRAALLYRAQTLLQDRALVSVRSEAAELIVRSRESRDRARQLSAKLDANVAELLDVIRQSAQAIEEVQATRRRIGAHMK